MSYADAFLADIVANPADDAPRLIYADWLDENGDPARAEFIRVQIELEKPREPGPELWKLQQREADLLHTGRNAWLGRVRDLVLGTTFRRGFAHTVTMEPAGFIEYADELFTLAPVQGLRLMTRTSVYSPPLTDPVGVLAAQPQLRRLIHLHINVPFNDEVAEAIAEKCSALQELELDGGYMTVGMVRPFLDAPHAVRLRSLSVAGRMVEADVLRTVAEAAGLAGLERFRLRSFGNELTAHHVEPMANSSSLKGLRWLDLSDNPLSRTTLRILAAARFMSELHSLTLTNSALGNGEIRVLAAELNTPRLRCLDLSRNHLEAASLQALAECSGLPALTDLTLRSNPCSPITSLLEGDVLPNLRTLHLRNGGLTDDDLRALARSKLLPRLMWLEVGNNAFTDTGLSSLLSADLNAVARIDLGGCRITPKLRERLTARLGDRVRFA